jgi:hypothetical protein
MKVQSVTKLKNIQKTFVARISLERINRYSAAFISVENVLGKLNARGNINVVSVLAESEKA